MKKIFWNVDTQYDFMREKGEYVGKLPVPGAQEIEKKLSELTKYARENKFKIINTADWHNKDSKEFSDNPDYKTTFPSHCIEGTKGAEFVEATRPINSYVIDWKDPNFSEEKLKESMEVILYKDAFNIFEGYPESPHADKVINIIKPENAVVYGVATNVCVNFAVRGLLERGVNVYVPLDAIKELPKKFPVIPLEQTLNLWKKEGAIFTTVEDIIMG